MKLEVGKTYRTRDGTKVKIISRLPTNQYEFHGKIHDCTATWQGDGTYCKGSECNEDLIEEFHVTAISAGKRYILNGGREAIIYARYAIGSRPIRGAIKQDDGSWASYAWAADGRCAIKPTLNISREATPKLALRSGGTYLTRSGRRVTITSIDGNMYYHFSGTFEGESQGMCWGEDGRYNVMADKESDYDLVAEAPPQEKRPVPWTFETAPRGLVMIRKKSPVHMEDSGEHVIETWTRKGIRFYEGFNNYQRVMDVLEHSVDGGKTWRPCSTET